ncbi:metalloprotease 1 precursor, partial [Aphelenchoides avenae]
SLLAVQNQITDDDNKEETPDIINLNSPLKDYLFQGDIAVTAEQAERLASASGVRTKRQAMNPATFKTTKWPTEGISYTVDQTIDEALKVIIHKALAFWSNNTCLSFTENGSSRPIIKFFKGTGCWSYVGRVAQWQEQGISLGDGCEHFGIATHEIAHALGFYHEQSRYDRDSHVTFLAQNVAPGYEDQFSKETPQTNDNFGQEYDYGSDMHYADVDFSRSEKVPLLLAKDPLYQRTMGSRIAPSFLDVLVMNKYYQCTDRCKTSQTKCQNGGYPHPRDCSRCICPWGFGGTLCNERELASNGSTTCGETIQAESGWNQLSVYIGEKVMEQKPDFTSCHWHITAPEGKKVELQVQYVGRVCSTGCFFGSVEFKMKDFTRTGYRMCCASDYAKKPTLTSDGNLAIVSLYTRYYVQHVKAQYRY